MPNVTYPLDTTGISPTNLVRDEPHVLTEINDATYRIIIPDFAPFYQDNFSLRYIDNVGGVTPLVKGVDFDFCLPYMDASRAIGKYMFGGITIHNAYVQGHLLVDYQTLGAEWVADKNYALEQLVSHNYNPRVVYWDQLTNVQQTFPPTSHAQDYDTIYGQKSVIEAIDKLIEAILQGPNPGNQYISHILSTGNVHNLTAADLGLAETPNIPLARDEELINSDPVQKLFSLRQMLESGIIPREAKTSELYTAIDNAIVAAVQQAQTVITRESLQVDLVSNLPVAPTEDYVTRTPVDKYVLLSQLIPFLVQVVPEYAGVQALEAGIEAARQSAVNEATQNAITLINNSGGGGGGGGGSNEVLTATQYYMSALFGWSAFD